MIDFNTITLLTGEAAAADAPASPSLLGTLGSLLPFLLLIPIFYFLMYRPQKKQEKETAAMRNSLMIGDEVVTIGGIIGKVVKVKDDYVVIETGADKARLKMRKTAIASVEKKADDEGNNQRTTFKVKAGKNEVPHDPENK
ncbi:MAG: preprotein translocase subunit YajC [Ruminococcaceae bacterium]|nr:preprotein translocase subunit YajC [Oscillospiraceae bacterium]